MDRRQYLTLLGAGTIGVLAGCTSDARVGGQEGTTEPAGTTTGSLQQGVGDFELPIPESELQRGAPKDAIPAIVEPEFGSDWEGVSTSVTDRSGIEYESEPRLDDDEEVIGIEREGEARAYPLAILNWHEVVNDSFHGPLLVTFCPLCGSGVTAERTVDGEETIFGVSGLLWQSDLVMYDEKTESLWSQILATAIRGPKTGTTMSLVPSTRTTWGEWREEHPETEVLLPPPISNTVQGETRRDYERDPYLGYEDSTRIGIDNNELEDDRLHPKAIVIGIAAGDVARAYPLDTVSKAGVVNDQVGDRPVVVTNTADDSLVAYDRRVDETTLEFSAGDSEHIEGGGSRWNRLSGEAGDGPHEGATLEQANDRSPMFWFAWVDFNPETEVFG